VKLEIQPAKNHGFVVQAVTGSAVVNAPKFSHTFFNKIIFAIL
jgi:hypothetical protein